MYRSFNNRVLGGICGGLAAALHLNAWWIRVLFVLLALVSVGAFAVLYILLWWVVPQESPTQPRRGFPLLLVIVLILLTFGAWAARELGQLTTPDGVSLFYPGALLLLCFVFFLRQVRA